MHTQLRFATGIAIALLATAGAAHATHVPPGSEPISYDGSLDPSATSSGSIGWTSPTDGYDWYCLRVVSGQQVTLAATRTSGDIQLNIGFLQGVANNGDPRSVLTELTYTSNNSNPDVTLNYTPGFTGPATIWVSTWLFENGGTYDLTVTGAIPGQVCAPTLAVEFDRVRAEPASSGVRVIWQTLGEDDTNGFLVVRGTLPAGSGGETAGALVEAHGAGLPYEAVVPASPDEASCWYVQELTSDGLGDRSACVPLSPSDGWNGAARSRRGRQARR
jgi:hypothetical protein